MSIEIYRDHCDPGCACYDTLNRDGVVAAWFTEADGTLVQSTHRREFIRHPFTTPLPTDEELQHHPAVLEVAGQAPPGTVFVWLSYHFETPQRETRRLPQHAMPGEPRWGLLIVKYESVEVSPEAYRP